MSGLDWPAVRPLLSESLLDDEEDDEEEEEPSLSSLSSPFSLFFSTAFAAWALPSLTSLPLSESEALDCSHALHCASHASAIAMLLLHIKMQLCITERVRRTFL
jgi:hypothetical protein